MGGGSSSEESVSSSHVVAAEERRVDRRDLVALVVGRDEGEVTAVEGYWLMEEAVED